ncbi:MAG: translation initiation factor IF-2, partial [Prevotella sp.]|nr:translation initiation factor IF-2 [Prevotella sp.]
MSVRLNKALRELNIGLQTAVEFLEKKSELGEFKAELSFKLNDEQYQALVEHFQQDKQVRKDVDKRFPKKPKEKPATPKPTAERGEDLLPSTTTKKAQEFKPLGKIDLDGNKKKTEEKPVAVQETPKKAEKPVAKEPTEKKKDEKPAAPKPEKEKEAVKTVVPEKKPVAEKKPEPAPQEKPQETPEKKTEPSVFKLKSDKKLQNTPQLKIQGKIDLDSLNQSTRPKKKSKEEKRKEREEKAAQEREKQRKKRVRIGKERVDINAAVNQEPMSPAADQSGKKSGKKKKNRGRNQKPLEVNEEDVARQVKETLARLTNKQSQNKKGAKYRKEKREAVQERLNEEMNAEQAQSKVLKLTEFVTVSELATMMNISPMQVISTLMSVGIMMSINQRMDAETINLVADEFGFKTEYVSAEVQEAVSEVEDDESDLISRSPIVTVMGHVDHGKTSLLDYIRKTNVIAGEAGGITQHIGAYNVKLEDGRRITFLDTPGHEAFTAMRARGTQVTDIAILISAADDSVMPTTKEAIAHAQAANVPMVFAINKIDKPGANPDKIREDLSHMNLLVEEWGGKYQSQEISAKQGIGVQELLEKVLLEAEMLELKANPNRKATGSIIESSLDKGRGYVSTVLVSNGTLKIGDNVIAGTAYGRIKAMFNERNQRITEAKPAEPCIILGLNGAPTAGDTFHVLETEQEARDIANKRLQLQREQGLRTQKKFTLDDISHRIALGEFH